MELDLNTKETALFWNDSGVATIPLVPRSKKPAVKWTPYRLRLPTSQEIDDWYQEPRNIALITGWQGLIILDFDNQADYSAWFVWQIERDPKVLDTFRVLSNRGIHLYYFFTESIKLTSIQGASFEIKSNGKLCTTAPSIHESGSLYQPLGDPTSIRVVSPEQILNYSPISFPPSHSSIQPVSKFAPLNPTNGNGSIEAIKERLSILDLLPGARQVDNEGRYWQSSCPLHGRSNNFWIDTKLGIGGCWAGCGNFDVISLWAALNGETNGEAIRVLAKQI